MVYLVNCRTLCPGCGELITLVLVCLWESYKITLHMRFPGSRIKLIDICETKKGLSIFCLWKLRICLDIAYCWKLKTEKIVIKIFLNMWIVSWDPVLKFFLLKKVCAGLVNNTRNPLFFSKMQEHTVSMRFKRTLNIHICYCDSCDHQTSSISILVARFMS